MSLINVFLDCEFTGLKKNTDLISIALVSESGKEYYAVTHYDQFVVDTNPFLKENVEPNLGTEERKSKIEIFFEITKFFEGLINDADDQIRIIGDHIAYDWVLFCDLFSGERWPEYLHYIPLDISSLFWAAGVDPDIKRSDYAFEDEEIIPKVVVHNALEDAILLKKCYEKFMSRCALFHLEDAENWVPDTNRPVIIVTEDGGIVQANCNEAEQKWEINKEDFTQKQVVAWSEKPDFIFKRRINVQNKSSEKNDKNNADVQCCSEDGGV